MDKPDTLILLARVLNQGYETHSIYMDFSKAFDLVDQNILLNELILLIHFCHGWHPIYRDRLFK